MFPTLALAGLVVLVLKSLVVVGMTEGLLCACPRLSASTRCLVLSAGLGGLLLLPFLNLAAPSLGLMSLDLPLGYITDALGVVLPSVAVPEGRPIDLELRSFFGSMAIALWAIGALVIVGQYAVQVLRRSHLSSRSTQVVDHRRHVLASLCAARSFRRDVLLKECSGLAIPITWGYLHPVVLLPTDSIGWTRETLGNVLRHELAHAARGDEVLRLLATAACAVWWFHPWVWQAAHRMRLEQERSCDDLALAAGVAHEQYGSDLVAIARSATRMQRDLAGAPAIRPSELPARLESILNEDVDRSTVGARHWLVAAAGVALLTMALTATASDSRYSTGASPASVTDHVVVSLDQPTVVKVELFDITGTSVRTLVDRELDAGVYTVDIGALRTGPSELPPGTYFCKVSTGSAERITKHRL